MFEGLPPAQHQRMRHHHLQDYHQCLADRTSPRPTSLASRLSTNYGQKMRARRELRLISCVTITEAPAICKTSVTPCPSPLSLLVMSWPPTQSHPTPRISIRSSNSGKGTLSLSLIYLEGKGVITFASWRLSTITRRLKKTWENSLKNATKTKERTPRAQSRALNVE